MTFLWARDRLTESLQDWPFPQLLTTCLEVGGHGPSRLLLRETGLRRKASDQVQNGNRSTRTLLHKALTEREKPWSLPFSPMGKGENSQGPVKIKIYITFVTLYNLCNLYNLHHRHLLVIFLLVWLGLCGWSRWTRVSCVGRCLPWCVLSWASLETCSSSSCQCRHLCRSHGRKSSSCWS